MHVPTLLTLALPLAAAQIPLLDQAKDIFAKLTGSNFLASAAHPVTSRVARAGVTDLTLENWKDTLVHSGSAKPGDAPEPWMVYVTGGNRSCHGMCGRVDEAWDGAATTMLADPNAPHLARIDCDDSELLCGAWAASAASVYVFQIPHPTASQSVAPTTLTVHYLNTTTATPSDITRIYTDKLYLDEKFKYEGFLHPFDGFLAQNGLQMPLAYVLFVTSKVPSWAFMIGLSFFSRYWVSKRMPRGVPPFARTEPVGAAPAGPAAAAKKRK